MRHYAFHIGDYAAATVHLSDAEDLAYRRLLDAYYAREAPLPADVAACCRLARATTPATRKAVDAVLREFFVLGADGWHQARCDAELARQRAKSESARSAVNVRHDRERQARRAVVEQQEADQHTDVARSYYECSENVERTQSRIDTSRIPPTIHDPQPTPPTVPPPSATVPPGEERVARERAPTRAKAPRKRPLPPEFAISDRVREWAAEKGHTRLEERFEHFIGKARANGYAYADWDEALMTAIRDDWAKLNGRPQEGAAASRLTPAGRQTAAALNRWMDDEVIRDGTSGP